MGDNLPAILAIQGNVIGRADHNGPNGQEGKRGHNVPLNATDIHATCIPKFYNICAYASNSMKSPNPHSGIQEVDKNKDTRLKRRVPCCNQGGLMICTPVMIENHPNDSRVKIDESGTTQTLTGRMGTGGGNVPLLLCPTMVATFMGGQGADAGSIAYSEECSPTIRANAGGNTVPMALIPIYDPKMQHGNQDGIAETELATQYKDPQIVGVPHFFN